MNNRKGALFMAAAMAGFTINDAMTKSLTHSLGVGQIIFLRGALACLFIYLLMRAQGIRPSLKPLGNPLISVRVACEMLSSVCYLTALSLIPLANAAAILQSLPLAVTFGAALVFRDPVGWRRWLAIIAGFVGVLIIIRPGAEGFTLPALYVVMTVFLAATRDLVTTRIHADTPSIVVTLLTAMGNSVAGFGLMAYQGWQPVNLPSFALLAAAALMLMGGYQCIILSMRSGEISFIAPFRYSSMLWAIGLGFLIFHEVPDLPMLIGMMIVVASGLYMFSRERKRRTIIAATAVTEGEA
ncbi:drug/metabolite transporter (DMT)-like permease [Rhizobium paknamense]|uniref:Drug/metabolite transporter (DMT)-like permease n=2 Tax=Rhizobium paknamense TaxID=1206817 RepID=A0ABU0I9H2_9HYPH|nr:drug/metabolite transporter (DMT)-like permease [Rhizobium paknamense]